MKDEPYFPVITPGHTYADGSFDTPEVRHYGATLRDEFAKVALGALITNEGAAIKWDSQNSDLHEPAYMADARRAYRYADAMMKAREMHQ